MRKIEFDKATFEWSFYGKLHAKFKLNLRHLFANLDVPTVALGWNFDDAQPCSASPALNGGPTFVVCQPREAQNRMS
jgi:hypothetical protein